MAVLLIRFVNLIHSILFCLADRLSAPDEPRRLKVISHTQRPGEAPTTQTERLGRQGRQQ